MSSTSSREYSRPPSVLTHSSWPAGESPRSASTLSTPTAAIASSVSRSSPTVEPTHVKCAIASMPYSSLIRETISIVLFAVLPPAPYVTDTKTGRSERSSPTASNRFRRPSSVFGGKNSNEKTGRCCWASSSSMRTPRRVEGRSAGEAPALGSVVRIALDDRLLGHLQMAQVAERLLHPPARGRGRRLLAVDRRDRLECGDRPALAQGTQQRLEPLVHERPGAFDVRIDVGEGPPVAGQREPRAVRRDSVERVEELPDRVGRVAVVVVERDAPEEMVARDEQPPLGLEQADVRRRVAGRLDHEPRAEVAAHLDAGQERPRRLDRPGDARRPGAPLALPLGERLRRGPRRPGDLDALLQHGLRVLRGARGVLVVGVHPQLAPRALDDRGGLAVVVDVRVRAHEQAHVLEAEVHLVHRALQMGEGAGLVHAAVEQDDACAGGDGPGVAVRHAGERERQAQAPDPGEHALAAADLPLAGGGRHPARTIRGLLHTGAWASEAAPAGAPRSSRRRPATTAPARATC